MSVRVPFGFADLAGLAALALAFSFSSAQAQSAQSAAALPFGSEDSRIEITVSNVDADALGVVSVRLAEAPPWLGVSPLDVSFPDVRMGEGDVASFTLVPRRDAPVGETETVRFVISIGEADVAERTFSLAVAAPTEVALRPVFPNPFRSRATVGYELATASSVTVTVFDLLGRSVAEPVDAEQEAGYHHTALDADRLAPGVYIVRLVVDSESGRAVRQQRVTVVR